MALDGYSAADKRYLRRFECAWCGHRLDWEGCGAIYERCDEATREERRRSRLEARRTQTGNRVAKAQSND